MSDDELIFPEDKPIVTNKPPPTNELPPALGDPDKKDRVKKPSHKKITSAELWEAIQARHHNLTKWFKYVKNKKEYIRQDAIELLTSIVNDLFS